MQRMELQFYAFFMTILSGVGLGVLFDLLRALRSHLRPNRLIGAAGDLLFWAAAAAMLANGLFFGNWGEFRLYVLVGLLSGLGLYSWLASPAILALLGGLLFLISWVLDLLRELVIRFLWAPLVALASLLVGAGRVLWRWVQALLEGVWDGVAALGSWLLRPLSGPYRWVRLRYLLAKRRIKRVLRRWLLGARPPRRR